MSATADAAGGGRLQGLRAVYDRDLAPFLAAEDAQLRSARRIRWPILIVGLGLSGGAFAYLVTRQDPNEILLFIDCATILGTILLFAAITGTIADDIRDKLLTAICGYFGFTYEPDAAKFPRDGFAVLDLAGCNHVRLADRVFGKADGLDFDLASGKLGDEWTELAPNSASTERTRLRIRFDGLLLRFADPAAPRVPFRLVPRAARVSPEDSTGDGAFDALFALEADDLPAARRALDAPARTALLAIAALAGDATPSIGFAGGSVALAFPTRRRFEIGTLRPPLADYARVEHLARQVAVVFDIGAALRSRRAAG